MLAIFLTVFLFIISTPYLTPYPPVLTVHSLGTLALSLLLPSRWVHHLLTPNLQRTSKTLPHIYTIHFSGGYNTLINPKNLNFLVWVIDSYSYSEMALLSWMARQQPRAIRLAPMGCSRAELGSQSGRISPLPLLHIQKSCYETVGDSSPRRVQIERAQWESVIIWKSIKHVLLIEMSSLSIILNSNGQSCVGSSMNSNLLWWPLLTVLR